MPLSSVDRIPPNPFSRDFREMIEEMRKELVGLLEQRQAIEEALERPWPYFERGDAGEVLILSAVIVSSMEPVVDSNIWEYEWAEAIPDENGDLVLKPMGKSSTDTGEGSAKNLTEQFNDMNTVSYGVDIQLDAPEPDNTFTVDVLPIPNDQGVILFTGGKIAAPPLQGGGGEGVIVGARQRYFVASNAINFTCVTPP